MTNGNIVPANGPKAFGAVFALLALVAGLYAMVKPLHQLIEANTAAITQLQEYDRAKDMERQARNSESATAREKVKGVETQVSALRQLHGSGIARLEKALQRTDEWQQEFDLDAAKWHVKMGERVRALERETFGVPLGPVEPVEARQRMAGDD